MSSATPPNTSTQAIQIVATRAGIHGIPIARTPAITRITPAAIDHPEADRTSCATLPPGPAISPPPPAVAEAAPDGHRGPRLPERHFMRERNRGAGPHPGIATRPAVG